jgi:hypothetical protein
VFRLVPLVSRPERIERLNVLEIDQADFQLLVTTASPVVEAIGPLIGRQQPFRLECKRFTKRGVHSAATHADEPVTCRIHHIGVMTRAVEVVFISASVDVRGYQLVWEKVRRRNARHDVGLSIIEALFSHLVGVFQPKVLFMNQFPLPERRNIKPTKRKPRCAVSL